MKRLKKLNFVILVIGIMLIYTILFSFTTLSAITVEAVETVFDSGGNLGSVILDNKPQCVEEAITWEEQVPVYDYVTKTRDTIGSCEEYSEVNQTMEKVSCITGTEEYQERVLTGTHTEQKSKTICKQDTSTLDIESKEKTISINYGLQGFNCVNSENKIICDSKNDGNGDGICQSGESCATFDIQKDKVLLTYSNSGEKQNCMERTIQSVPFVICTDESAIINKLEVRE